MIETVCNFKYIIVSRGEELVYCKISDGECVGRECILQKILEAQCK